MSGRFVAPEAWARPRSSGFVSVTAKSEPRRAGQEASHPSRCSPRACRTGSAVYTDALASYTGLNEDYDHATVDHAERYVLGRVHTNGIENFWALLKRGLKGTYVAVAPEHLTRYLDERMFTYNHRDLNDFGRFVSVLGQDAGRRPTYAELTGKA